MVRLECALVSICAGLLGAACSGTPATEPNTGIPVPEEPSPAQPTSPARAGTLEVHEWGVIDVPPSGPLEVAAGPGRSMSERPRPAMRKPVLYFHLDTGAPPLDVSVTARIPGGSMLEVWPAGQLSADSIAWSPVRVGQCPTPAPSVATLLPQLRATRWASLDGYNEVFELPEYETSDAACLTSGTATGRLLFYRGAIPTAPLPIEVARDAQLNLVMRASTRGEGSVILTASGGRGITMPWPAVRADVALPDAFTESFEGAQLARTLERELTARGLTASEAGAFMRAWSMPFFGVAPPPNAATRDLPETRRESPNAVLAGARPSLIYVMPEATVARVAELTITPTPRLVRRVMVVRIDLIRR